MVILFMPPKIAPPIQRSGRHELAFCSGTESARHHTYVLSERLRRIEMGLSCMTVEHVPSCGRSFVSVVDSELSDHRVSTSELVCDMHSVFHWDLQIVCALITSSCLPNGKCRDYELVYGSAGMLGFSKKQFGTR
jgi:hypothetical protein